MLACGLPACDRGKDSAQNVPPAGTADQVERRTPKPDYTFVAGLEEQHPEVTGFLRHFLETCLAGDYTGYRRLVSRAADPESRARFETILNSLRSLTVEAIEEVDLPAGPSPAYLVTSKVDFLPHRKVALRRGSNSRVAILVLEEDGELRMTLAPSELQPGDEEEELTSGPTTSAPSYPWQEDGDY